MADDKISQLPTGTVIGTGDIFPFTRNPTGSAQTQQASFQLIRNTLETYFDGQYQGTGTVGGASVLVQRVEGTPFTTYTTGTVSLPFDDSIPQITEGRVLVSGTITPNSATNRLVIRVHFEGTSNPATATMLALFQDPTADALKTVAHGHTANQFTPIDLVHEMAAGGTSAITFVARVGNNAGGTTYINGTSAGRQFGGSLSCTISIEEIRV